MSENLTPTSAEKYSKELFNNIKGLERDFLKIHSKGVLNTCIKLAKHKKVDLDKLKIASWLHDIGRTQQIKDHAKISVKLAEEKFGKLDEITKDCILNHGNSKNPKTEEGKIIQFADKFSILNNYELIEMVFSKKKYYSESKKFLKMVCEDFIEILDKYDWGIEGRLVK